MHLLEKQVSLHFRVFPVIPSVAIVIQRPNLQHLFPHLQVTQHTPSGFIPPASIYCHQDTNIILIVKLTEYIWVLCFSTFWSSQTEFFLEPSISHCRWLSSGSTTRLRLFSFPALFLVTIILTWYQIYHYMFCVYSQSSITALSLKFQIYTYFVYVCWSPYPRSIWTATTLLAIWP